jgi:hypothetical protein
MRKIMLPGATILSLAFGVAHAIAGDVDPRASPYAVISPITVAPAPVIEHRAADVQGSQYDDSLHHRAQQSTYGCFRAQIRIQRGWHEAQICE